MTPVAYARAATTCGTGTYAYAGVGSKDAVRGISATITATAAPNVRDGHVAGWVGVSSADGSGWLQVGLSAFPGDAASRLYYELTAPGQKTLYRELAAAVPFGQPHQFAVVELPTLHDWWQATIDGVPAGVPVYMPGSDRRWRGQAVGESWAGTTSGACNDYGYSFSALSVQRPGASQWISPTRVDVFQDPGYVLSRSSAASFVAASTASHSAVPRVSP